MMPHPSAVDVVVIGAGVVGAATARLLAKAGLSVALVERERPGAEASSASAGVIAPIASPDVHPSFLRMAQLGLELYPDLVAAIADETGLPIEYRVTGRLFVALKEADVPALEAYARGQRAAGMPVEELDSQSARAIEPGLSERVVAAVLSPDQALVDNTRLTTGLAMAAARAGARVHVGRPVTGLVIEGNAARGVRLGGETISAGAVVNAAGCWAGSIDPRAGLPIAPAKGEMIAFQTWPPVVRHVLGAPDGASLVPRADGRVLYGGTLADAGYDKRTTGGAVAWLLSQALAMVPSLGPCTMEVPWVGLRPRSTADELPIVGADPRWSGLYHATGHFRKGIACAPATARAIAHLIAGTPSPLDLAPFSPARLDLESKPSAPATRS